MTLVRGNLGKVVVTAIAVLSVPAASALDEGSPSASAGGQSRSGTAQDANEATRWAATMDIDSSERYGSPSDGDLWPSCWSSDGNLYAAWGDGRGFDLDGPFTDIGVARLSGPVDSLTGENLALGDDVGTIWNEDPFNRKPTGMVCVEDTIYLAVQDLRFNFNQAPAATIAQSTDGGQTWTWDTSEPMFDDGVFTTIWFADFGQGGEWAPDRYVYAYGLDGNWRDSFDDSVADPTDVFLARIPKDRIQDRRAWQFFTGTSDNGNPRWSRDVDRREPVIHDERRVYGEMFSYAAAQNMTVLSQGSVLYNAPLDRYIYSSWTEYTFELYSSPTPWGPWEHLATRDFGGYPWTEDKHGGYATTLPSKFLSEDGLTLHLQANVCPCAPAGMSAYRYSLREVRLQLPEGEAGNPVSEANLADPSNGAVPVSKSSRLGELGVIIDGDRSVSEDDRDDELKSGSWWGVTWPREYRVNRVVFTSGEVGADGGWFLGRPNVQVRSDGQWVDVVGQLLADPPYPGDASAGPFETFTYTFPSVVTDGVRITGVPGGDRTWTSAAEVEVYRASQLVDGGFEGQPGWIVPPWHFEGEANYGLDCCGRFSRSGENSAWIRTFDPVGSSAFTQQVDVVPGATYTFSGWFRTSPVVPRVRLAVRWDGGGEEALSGPSAAYEQRSLTFTVPEDVDQVTLVAGYDAEGGDAVLQFDDLALAQED